MPRNTEKNASKPKGQAPSVLRFISSLLFLLVLFGGAYAGSGWWSPLITNGAGSLWLPLFLGAAVLASIALFFGSIAGIVLKNDFGIGGKVSLIASFALVVLTVTTAWTTVFWIVIVGFILGWIASAIENTHK